MKYFPKKLTMTWIRNSYKDRAPGRKVQGL